MATALETVKRSFLMYTEHAEFFRELSREQAGELIVAIMDYETTQIEPSLGGVVKMAFIAIRQDLDRNRAKHNRVSGIRSDAGKKGNAKRWQAVASDRKNRNSDDNDNDNDNENENDNENIGVASLNGEVPADESRGEDKETPPPTPAPSLKEQKKRERFEDKTFTTKDGAQITYAEAAEKLSARFVTRLTDSLGRKPTCSKTSCKAPLIKLMRNTDPHEVKRVIDYVTTPEYLADGYKPVVLSASALCEKFDRVLASMNRGDTKGSRGDFSNFKSSLM